MLSKARIKFIKSLQVKKYRLQEQRFVVEGAKSVIELLNSDFSVEILLATKPFILGNTSLLAGFRGELVEVSPKDLITLGEFQTNDSALAVAQIKPNEKLSPSPTEYTLVLDDIRDPGNFGTIIRLADWYGIKSIIASSETADFYNPKVLHSSMGSFTRVSIWHTELQGFLEDACVPIYGAFLDGENVHTVSWADGGFIVVGNEAHGISHTIEKLITHRITIQGFGKAESLNAAIATGIICDNLRRVKGVD